MDGRGAPPQRHWSRAGRWWLGAGPRDPACWKALSSWLCAAVLYTQSVGYKQWQWKEYRPATDKALEVTFPWLSCRFI